LPIETPLNVPPYGDDFDPKKDYYKLMFKPHVSVQVRELNQLQTLLQNQIEKFGDNIIKRGTIVEGCNFNFYANYPYAKLNDNELDGDVTIPTLYVGLFAKNSANVRAYIINSADGFESQAPDLKTIYLNYINAGNDSNTFAFTAGDTLTIYDSNNSVFKVEVDNGGVNFANSDTVVFSPQVAVTISSGTFSPGDYLCQPSTGANVHIDAVDSSTLSALGQVLLSVSPRNDDLANVSSNSIAWTIEQSENVTNPAASVAAVVQRVFGRSAQARVITNGIGRITDIVMTNQGIGYEYEPQVRVKSANNASGISALDLTGRNYMAQVKVSATANSVGSGYAFGITEGYTYQKGYFLRVNPQVVIVDKYSVQPNNVSVGFNTTEEVVTYNSDSSLLDPVIGTDNTNAPGADRLKLTPRLIVMDLEAARANAEFFNLVEWSDGAPYKQNRVTQYSRLGDEMAQRTFDESGNYVIDTFQVTTRSTANTDLEGSKYTVLVDPGQCYIGGYKVQTLRNFLIDVEKGTQTRTGNNTVSLNYGNYVRVKEIGGYFQFSTGDTVELYNTAKGFLSNTALAAVGNVDHVGTQLGTARVRSLIYENGNQGVGNTVNRLFLFDVKMNPGQNFRDVRSIAYGANLGICDVVLTTDPTTEANIALLEGQKNNRLIFSAGCESLKNSNNVNYIYRTINRATTFANSGILTKSIAANPDEFYPYSSSLSDSQMRELFVVPVGAHLVQYDQLAGNVSVNTTAAAMVGDGTNFFEAFEPGDWVNIRANTTANTIKQIISITNAEHAVLDANCTFANAECIIRRTFPKNVPIPFGSRNGLEAAVDANGNILTLTLGHSNGDVITLEGSVSVNTAVAVNIRRTGVTSESKSCERNKFVKIRLANNAGGVQGPWCLGVPDIFRLRNVYVGDVTVDESDPNIVTKMYIDHNQNANYLDLGWLMIAPRTGLVLTSDQYLLVEFDYYTRSDDGYFDAVSYRGTSNAEQIAELDSTALDDLTTQASSWEVPEVYTYDGKYYDMLSNFDFRPAVANTVAPSSTVGGAPINPPDTLSFGDTADVSNDKKFPLPDSAFTGTIEYYLGRVDSVYIGGDKGNIYVLKGIPDSDPKKRLEPNHPKTSLKLQTLTVPPYPNLCRSLSTMVQDLMSTKVANERSLNLRARTHLITPILSTYQFQLSQPMVYTMEDIGNLERRIADLEYYVSLSVLETNLTNKIIPSSVDRTLTRFKYGFFADDFSTDHFSDIANPQYAAAIEMEGHEAWGFSKNPLDNDSWAGSDRSDNPDSKALSPTMLLQRSTNRLVPPKFSWLVPHCVRNIGYIQFLAITQNNATDTVPSTNCIPANSTSNTANANSYIYNSQMEATDPTEVRTNRFVFGNSSGYATVYFYHYTGYSSIDVFKNGTIIMSTNASANAVSQLTANDKIFLTNNNYARSWYNLDVVPDLTQNYVRGTGALEDYVNYAGKLTFFHDPATGNQYDVRVRKGNGLQWKYLLEYPFNGASLDNTTLPPCPSNPPPPEYVGTMSTHVTFGSSWGCSKGLWLEIITEFYLEVEVTGLKPNTLHKFIIDGFDVSPFTAPTTTGDFVNLGWGKTPGGSPAYLRLTIPSKVGQPLISNANGRLRLTYLSKNAAQAKTVFYWLEAVGFNQSYGSSGYTTLEVRAPGSVATKLVAARDKSKPLPGNPVAAA
jgi:hypothetical protein